MSLFADLFIFRSSPQERRSVPFWMFLAAFSGWANALIILYLPFSFSERFFTLRVGFTVAVLLCLGATFVLFATTPFVPLIGYFLWLLGVLLIIFPLEIL